MDVVASLTTLPKRVKFLPDVIEALLKSSVPISEIHINVPYLSRRTGEEYDLSNLPNLDNRVRIFRTPDFGPITKVAPTFTRLGDQRSVYVYSVDDDFMVTHDSLARLAEVRSHGDAICRFGGGSMEMVGLQIGTELVRQVSLRDMAESYTLQESFKVISNHFLNLLKKIMIALEVTILCSALI